MTRIMILSASVALLAACSSSSGSGSRSPETKYIVVPAGQTVVCQDGTAPPCR